MRENAFVWVLKLFTSNKTLNTHSRKKKKNMMSAIFGLKGAVIIDS